MQMIDLTPFGFKSASLQVVDTKPKGISIREKLELREGDYVEIDIKKIK